MNETIDGALTTEPAIGAGADHWYLHFWPWVLICIPFSAVLFGILMVTMVASYPDDLVVDDYYKDGMAINQIRTLDKTALKMGVTAKMIKSEEGSLQFLVENANDSALVLNLYHVTDSELDTSVILYPQDNGVYAPDTLTEGADPSENTTEQQMISQILSSTGIWYLELNGADEPWRLRARVITPITSLSMGGK